MDFGAGPYSNRKLSVSIQLADPADYDGGSLEFAVAATDPMLRSFRTCPISLPASEGVNNVLRNHTWVVRMSGRSLNCWDRSVAIDFRPCSGLARRMFFVLLAKSNN